MNGDNDVSFDKDRVNIPKTPKNIPAKDVQESGKSGGTGETRLSETTRTILLLM